MKLLTAFLIIISFSGKAQTIYPNESAFNRSLIKNSRDFYKITWVTKEGEQSAMLQDFIRVKDNYLIRLQVRHDGKRDSSVADLATLKPIYLSTKTPFSNDVFQYQTKEVIHTSVKKGKSQESKTYLLTEEYFDSFLAEYMIGLLPLKVGYTAKLPFFSDTEKKIIYWEIRDIGLDAISLNGKNYIAYLATVDTGSSKGLYWIDKDSGQLLKVLFQLPNNGLFIKQKV